MEVKNRFKGLDLIDSVPDELWTEVHDIVQETGIKTIPMEKKCKKAKWLSVKRREVKSKGEKERFFCYLQPKGHSPAFSPLEAEKATQYGNSWWPYCSSTQKWSKCCPTW